MKTEIKKLVEEAAAYADELINMALVEGGSCIKSEVLDNCDHIIEALSRINNLIE